MPEPLTTPEIPRPQNIVIGETAIHLASPQKIGENQIDNVVIQSADKRANAGAGSAVILMKEASGKKGEEGVMIDKPSPNVNAFEEVPWEKVSGIRLTDESGGTIDIPKEQLRLTQPENITPSETPIAPMATETAAQAEPPAVPEIPVQPPIAREVLTQLTNEGNTITIVGLKAYETRALDLADRAMQKVVTPGGGDRAEAALGVWSKSEEGWNQLKDIGRTIWKQSIGGIYFHEKARQYYLGMLKAAETPFAEDSIRLAEARAKITYDKMLADEKNIFKRTKTRVVEWFKDNLGMQTTIQKLALDELTSLKAAGEIKGQEIFVREAAAVRARFGQDMGKADQFVRQNLGEHLEILDQSREEYQPIVSGMKDLFTRYASGEIKDKQTFDTETKAFFQKTLKDAAPKVFAEAELYSSSLFEAAETIRAKMSHEAGITNIDEAMAGMEIRLAMGTMGEVTSVDPTVVQKGVAKVRSVYEYLNRKHVLTPMALNEATIGASVAIALSLANFAKTMPARALTGIGGGALAGGLFAGWREYGQLQKDYLTHLRERESGSTFAESMKRRQWFEKYTVKQRSAEEMLHSMRDTVYETDGTTLKATLTDDEIRTGLATIADTQARKAVSETGAKRIGLIQFRGRESIETERAALDLTANKALGDLENYLTNHAEQAQTVLGEQSYADFMEKLTQGQTRVLREGTRVLSDLDDPVKGVLGIVSSYAPEIDMIKRRWPLASRMATSDEKAMGVDAILEEFRKEARIEAVKYGIKAGVIGAAVGVTMRGVTELFAHGPAIGAAAGEKVKETLAGVSNKAELGSGANALKETLSLSPPNADHTIMIDNHPYIFPKELTIEPQANNTFDAMIHLPNGTDVPLGDNVTKDQLFATLHGLHIATSAPQEHVQVNVLPPHESTVDHLVGLDGKPVTMTLPEGYQIKYIDSFKDWSVIDKQGDVVASHLKILSDGSIQNTADAAKQFTTHHLDFDTKTMGSVPREALPETLTTAPTGEVTLEGSAMEKGGIWDYFLGKFHGENAMAATNGEKNLFRLYEQYMVPHNADGTPQNITFSEGNPYHHTITLRDATFGDNKIKDIDISRIPNDATIHLDKALFGPDSFAKFEKFNDLAIHDYQELVKTGLSPMDALHKLAAGNDHQKAEAMMLRLGYFGRDSDLPTNQADLAPLLKELGAVSQTTEGVTPGADTLHHVIVSATKTTDMPGQIFAEQPITVSYHMAEGLRTATEVAAAGQTNEAFQKAVADMATNKFPWIPIFIPLRESLEAFPQETVEVKPRGIESFMSPVGADEAYLSQEAASDRLSPRLKEQNSAKLSPSEEITWYLAAQSPEEAQLLASLKAQHESGLAPETRAVVMIPVTQNGSSIYQTLSQYVAQTDKNGNPMDPKHAELVVFDYLAGEQAADNTKVEVDRFKTEHPDTPVVYLAHTYDTPPQPGKVKRDMSTFVLDRINTLSPDHADVAILTHANATISPTYLSSVVESFDATPEQDLVYGSYRMPQEAYTQFPMLFASLRAAEVFDALVRQGHLGGMPGIYDGNIAVKAATLAAVGGYNAAAPGVEDRELTWLISRARGDNPQVVTRSPDLTATLDPKEMAYTALQQLGLADRAIALGNNALYRDKSWQEIAKKASDAFTTAHLEAALTNIYTSVYPKLKQQNPELFDAYFKRTMDTLGLTHEFTEGKVVIGDTTALGANMAADIDVESMAKEAVQEIKPVENPREVLTQIAEPQQETPQTEAPTEPPVAQPEPPTSTNP